MKLFWGLVLCVPLVTFADTDADFKKLFGAADGTRTRDPRRDRPIL